MKRNSGKLFVTSSTARSNRRELDLNKLSDSERKAITARIRKLYLMRLKAGVSSDSMLRCHCCAHTRPAAGAVVYGRFRLCNDCALSYELARAEAKVKTIEEFVLGDQ